MKNIVRYKALQLALYVIISVGIVFFVMFQTNIYYLMAQYNEAKILFILVWGLMALGFVFLFVDMSLYSKQYKYLKTLGKAAKEDLGAHIANRYALDNVIKKYEGKETIPEDMCCIIFSLTSVTALNSEDKRQAGDLQIRAFSSILNLSALDYCFVGRNGGNQFLAIFEKGDRGIFSDFIDRIERKVCEYNMDESKVPIFYKYGLAFNRIEKETSVRNLVVKAFERSKKSVVIPGEYIMAVIREESYEEEYKNYSDEELNYGYDD